MAQEVDSKLMEKIRDSADTKFMLICNNSAYLELLKATSYPFCNCSDYFVYCMKEVYAYENMYKFNSGDAVKVTSCPEEIVKMVSSKVRLEYQKVMGHTL